MAKLAPLSIAELDRELATLLPSSTDDLRGLHTLLMRATPGAAMPRYAALAAVSRAVAELPGELVDALQPRPRTVFRLLRAGAVDAAWAVLVDNATGVVDEPFAASTSSGATRKAWRLPLLTRIEPPIVFADLPGLRDPRFGAPEECYDITEVIRLRHLLDEVWVNNAVVMFGGWAALDPLVTGPAEQIRLIASRADVDVSVAGRRLRRADLAAGSGESAERRTWAGWSARLDLDDPRVGKGAWALSIEIEHEGISRRAPLGAKANDLARAATNAATRVGGREVRWDTSGRQWRFYVG